MQQFTYEFESGTLLLEQENRRSSFKAHFNGEEIFAFSDYSHAVRGDEFNHGTLGHLQLKFEDEKEGFSVQINSIHHEKSGGHPGKQLKPVGLFSILIAITFLVNLIFTLSMYFSYNSFYADVIMYIVAATVIYLLLNIFFLGWAAYLAFKRRGASVIIAISVISFSLLLTLFVIFIGGARLDMFSVVFFVLKTIALGVIISKVKYLKEIKANKKGITKENADILA